MPRICQLCSQPFPTKIRVGGQLHNLQNRKYCLTLSPYKAHNTRKLIKPFNPANNESQSAEASRAKFRRYQRKKRRHRKQLLIKMLGGQCLICGYNRECSVAFSFHHRDPACKSFEVSKRGLLRRMEELLAEVRKCVLLCCRCHSEVHAGLHKDWERLWEGQVAQLVEHSPEKAGVAGSSPALSTRKFSKVNNLL